MNNIYNRLIKSPPYSNPTQYAPSAPSDNNNNTRKPLPPPGSLSPQRAPERQLNNNTSPRYPYPNTNTNTNTNTRPRPSAPEMPQPSAPEMSANSMPSANSMSQPKINAENFIIQAILHSSKSANEWEEEESIRTSVEDILNRYVNLNPTDTIDNTKQSKIELLNKVLRKVKSESTTDISSDTKNNIVTYITDAIKRINEQQPQQGGKSRKTKKTKKTKRTKRTTKNKKHSVRKGHHKTRKANQKK